MGTALRRCKILIFTKILLRTPRQNYASSTLLILQVFRWCWITPPSRNGEGPKPNRALVNRYVRTRKGSLLSNQWNRSASRSCSRIRTWRNALRISPAIATEWNRPLRSTFHSWFCRLVIRRTLGPDGVKQLCDLPLPPALVMYLNYFHELRQE